MHSDGFIYILLDIKQGTKLELYYTFDGREYAY